MMMFLHKIVLAIVRIENKKYTSLTNHITSLAVPIVYQSLKQKVKNMCAKIKNLLIIATIKLRVFPNLHKKYIENKRLFVDFIYFFTIKSKNIKSKKVKMSKK